MSDLELLTVGGIALIRPKDAKSLCSRSRFLEMYADATGQEVKTAPFSDILRGTSFDYIASDDLVDEANGG